jgi:serine/threonine protein kinase
MSLVPGARLGPYEICAALGSGGMGEVYRARDTRLERDVAVKVLPSSVAKDPDRLRRFETEARAAGALNHPNVLAVHDVGSHDAAPFLVTELLDGETLRERLKSGSLGMRKALDYALQIARGLAAAHAKGIVHRDLKPENLFVTRDARVKILDFGLAKLRPAPDREAFTSGVETLSALTAPNVVLGTVGYMSPEQVQGRPADHRSDLFAFGAVAYEMLSGSKAFSRATSAETLTAILHDEPPELSSTGTVPPALERLVRHCLEKDPAERFQSAGDLAFALDALSAGHGASAAELLTPSSSHGPWPRRIMTFGILAASVVAAVAFGRWTAPERIPEHELLTARPGSVTGSRFTPDGASILYSIAAGAGPPRVFLRRLDSPETGALDLPPASVLSISSRGEAAILLTRDRVYSYAEGSLARVALTGGAPRLILEGVSDADWGPDGERLCVLRRVSEGWQLEFPIGSVLLREFAQFPRVSRDGERVAFKNEAGDIEVVDRAGRRRSLGGKDLFIFGLAWGPTGGEVWCSASDQGLDRDLWAIDLAGKRRLLARGLGANLTLLDVAADGKTLVMSGRRTLGLRTLAPGARAEREVATATSSLPVGLSGDGRAVLMREFPRARPRRPIGSRGEALLAASDGSSSVRLGPGQALTLSPDGLWALCLQGQPPRLVELPTGPGEPRAVPFGRLYPDGDWGPARWSADGETLFVAAREPGKPRRIFARRRGAADWLPATPEGVDGGFVLSPDGGRVATAGPRGLVTLYALDGASPRELPDTFGVTPVHWTDDGHALYVRTAPRTPAVLERLDLRTGRREPSMQLMPDDPDGVNTVFEPLFTPGGRLYVYSYNRNLGDIYLITGLR